MFKLAYVIACVCTWCASMCGLRKAHQHAAGGVLCIRDWEGGLERLYCHQPQEKELRAHTDTSIQEPD